MRTSKYLITTSKETPSDADTASHQLMLRAGLIRKLASGLYTWLPLGHRTLQKLTEIIRQSMNETGALELLMPVVQPSQLWRETDRWTMMGPELLRFKDRNSRDFCLGPTHEEVITDLVRDEINSHRQLPTTLYQIQTKFRDEIRPRFGVMRSREFIMKDAYSFHLDQNCLDQTYDVMKQTYSSILNQLQLDYRIVDADSGNIGGNASHEFHVLADSGEDEIVFSSKSDYAANVELAIGTIPQSPDAESQRPSEIIETPDITTIKDLCSHLSIEPSRCVKTVIVQGCDQEGIRNGSLITLVIRGDQTINEIKAEKLKDVAAPFTRATENEITSVFGCVPGYLGPLGNDIKIYADPTAAELTNFTCGANIADKHIKNANWDVPSINGSEPHYDDVFDIRKVREGDLSPDGEGTLSKQRGIEVGHIFQLGKKYSASMNATALDTTGKGIVLSMGCYGIGVTRLIAACIEQKHDEYGIIWPKSIAPFLLVIIQVDGHKSEQVIEISEKLYNSAKDLGVDVLLDDRDKKTSPGVKFADSELIGIPHRFVVSPKAIADGFLEYKKRSTNEKTLKSITECLQLINEIAEQK